MGIGVVAGRERKCFVHVSKVHFSPFLFLLQKDKRVFVPAIRIIF